MRDWERSKRSPLSASLSDAAVRVRETGTVQSGKTMPVVVTVTVSALEYPIESVDSVLSLRLRTQYPRVRQQEWGNHRGAMQFIPGLALRSRAGMPLRKAASISSSAMSTRMEGFEDWFVSAIHLGIQICTKKVGKISTF